MLLWIALLILFCIVNSDTSRISLDGTINYLQSRGQSSRESNSAFAIKYRSAQALITIQKVAYTNDDITSSSVFYKKEEISGRGSSIVVFVGDRWEALAARRLSMQWVENYERECTGTCVSAERLGLGIANLAHEQSIYPSTQQLLYNTIVMGSHKKEYINISNQNNQTNDSNRTNETDVVYVPCILRVDVSGNFYRCDATSVGLKASAIRNWLETKGAELIRNQTNITESENNDILTVMGLAYHCVIDNYDEMNGHSINTNDTHLNIQIAFNGFDYNNNQIIGPIALSNQIFNSTNTSCATDKNETQGSIRQQGLRIWTFLKQSKLIN